MNFNVSSSLAVPTASLNYFIVHPNGRGRPKMVKPSQVFIPSSLSKAARQNLGWEAWV